LSEQFVLVSWDGCQGDASDERFKMFLAKLTPETPPTVLAQQAASKQASLVQANGEEVTAPDTANSDTQASAGDDDKFASPTRYIHRDENFIGDKLGLYFAGNWHENWGDRQEKWLRGRKLDGESTNEECWYYLTRDGDLFRWDAVDSPPASLARIVYRWLFGKEVKGTLVHSFG